MQKRDIKWYIIFAVAALAAIGASIWTYVDMVGLCINIGSVLIMASIIVWSLGYLTPKRGVGLRYLADAAAELRAGTEAIITLSNDTELSADDALRIKEADAPLFKNADLRQAYTAHRRELDRLYRDDSSFRFSDIAEYVNQELLDHIGNMSFCDIVGGSMTGLGILGTFLGLMIGLQDFDPSTADAMLLTIPTLIDGIKIAFLTSIFGVVFSLLFNMYSRGVQEDATDALDEFLGAYYKHVIPQPENDGFTQLIRYQQSQTDSMAQFAEEMSLTMANALKENVAPVFERIEASISTLSERFAKSQSEAMDEVATRFVEHMDQAMGNQLTHLGENIQKLCQWQDETIGKMEQTIHAFSEAGEKVGAVNAKLDASFDSLEQYMQNIAKLQEKVNADFTNVLGTLEQVSEKLELQNRSTLDSIEAQKNLAQAMNDAAAGTFEKINAYQEAALNTQKELAAYSAAMKDTLRTTSESVAASIDKASADFAKTSEHICNEITKSSASVQDNMGTAVQTAISAMDGAIQTELKQMQVNSETAMSNMEKAFAEFAKTTEQVRNEMIECSVTMQAGMNTAAETTISAMSAAIQEELRQMQANSEVAVSSMEKAFAEFSKTAERVRNEMIECSTTMQRGMNTATQSTISAMNEAIQTELRQMQANMESIEKTQRAFIDGMNKSSEQLTHSAAQMSAASNDLTNNLDKAMSRTYQEIDRQLAEIVRHLSGTIADIRDVTEQLPKILASSAAQAQKTTELYLSTISDSQKQLVSEIKRHNQTPNNRGEK